MARVIPKNKLLGDLVAEGLKAVGVTEEKVTKWLGRPCGCPERRKMLNDLDRWARNLFNRDKPPEEKTEEARRELSGIMGEVQANGTDVPEGSDAKGA